MKSAVEHRDRPNQMIVTIANTDGNATIDTDTNGNAESESNGNSDSNRNTYCHSNCSVVR